MKTVDVTPTDEGFANMAAAFIDELVEKRGTTKARRDMLSGLVEITFYLGSTRKVHLRDALMARATGKVTFETR